MQFLNSHSRRSFLALSGAAGVMSSTQSSVSAGAGSAPAPLLWLPAEKEADSYASFRGVFDLSRPADVTLRFLGASWFVLWIDGVLRSEGPARFVREYPEFQSLVEPLNSARHVIAVQVHYEGLSTRMLEDIAPFWMCSVQAGSREIPVRWRAAKLAGCTPQFRRVNPQLGWAEWCDTRNRPAAWQVADFDDSSWSEPVLVHPGLGSWQAVGIAEVRTIVHPLAHIAEGQLVEQYGYEADDPPARLFLRDLNPAGLPAQGVWRRYDLGRVRLGRPRLVLDVLAGAAVEIAYSEALHNGRVSPWITLSLGQSCNLDHFIARGGEQEFLPFSAKGGRFVEVHVLAPPERVRFLREDYLERTYHGAPVGELHTGEALLDQIWTTGIETYRSCSEDVVIDNPTRERGQWAGDVASVGMEIAAAGYSDLRLFRRGLIQCARSARADGLVAGLCPGGRAYLSTYAAQWITACLRYRQLTGDKTLLAELFPAAERNVEAFVAKLKPEGVTDDLGWGFVDWGYVRNEGPVDIGMNLHFFAALQDMVRWCKVLEQPTRATYYSELAGRLRNSLSAWFANALNSAAPWETIGLHRAVLGLRLGFIPVDLQKQAVAAIQGHILRCFPVDPAAPRLSDPTAANPRLFTPYFAHYAFPELILRGGMDFVLDIYRRAWGWALGDGRTTWLEVFDPRWSHCHQWSGCPTWQLSRFLLGLNPAFDQAANHYTLQLIPGLLKAARGRVPLPKDGGVIQVEWRRQGQILHYRLETPTPIVLHPSERDSAIAVEKVFEYDFPARYGV